MTRMDDLIILIPGIMGSVLQKDKKDIWAISKQAIWSSVISLGSYTDNLFLKFDDLKSPDLDDGITAGKLISDVCIIPGLIKIDGYSGISKMIKDNFIVTEGSLNDDAPANYFEFPYDWRRDCRVSAEKLKDLINRQLPKLRVKNKDAKVILLAHSMGGIVARYYLENLGGWKNCKALISFGTPYRGSLNAVNFLANGYKKLFLDFTEILRSFTSVYQLLPIYESIEVDGEFKRIGEMSGITGINDRMASEALKFHRSIEEVVTKNLDDMEYRKNGYKLLPMVGINQPTFQAAKVTNGEITVSKNLPSLAELGLSDGDENAPKLLKLAESGLSDGDGTVPMISAIPIEMSQEFRDSFYTERHASLQNNNSVLTFIYTHLKRMQTDITNFRGSVEDRTIAEQPALSVDLEDLYLTGEPVTVKCNFVNTTETSKVTATIESVKSENNFQREYVFTEDSDGLILKVEGLPSGIYRIKVEASEHDEKLPKIHDIFEVM